MTTYLDRKISAYRNMKDLIGVEIPLRTFLFSEKNKEAVELIRATKDEEEQTKLKEKLPCVTISGVFDAPRSDEALKQHSGLLCLDIDRKDNKELDGKWEELKHDLAWLPYIFYCGLSVRGNGLFAIVPIANTSKHREYFRALEQIFKKQWKIKLDTQCVNESRIRYCTYDPLPYVNENATTFDYVLTEKKREVSTNNSINNDNETLDICVGKCERYRVDITSNYTDWFKVGCALADGLGEQGRDYFHRLSQIYSNYKYHETNSKYNDCLRSGKTPFAWLFSYFRDCGITYEDEIKESRRSEHNKQIEVSEPPTLTTLEQMQLSNPVLTNLISAFDLVPV